MTQPTINIPNKLRQRPRYGGLPIPYTTLVTNGIPDFRVIDEHNRLLCIKRHLCALCGQEIKRSKLVVFIGGEQCCGHGRFIDPGMHEECALYAASVCPYLTGDHTYRAGDSPNAQQTYDLVTTERPKRMGLYYARSYDIIVADGHVYIQAWPAVKIDWGVIPPGPDSSPALPDGPVLGPTVSTMTSDHFTPKANAATDAEATTSETPVGIVYNELITGHDGVAVIARLRADGIMLIGRSEDTLREIVFFIDPTTGRPWVPGRDVFVSSVAESLANNEYDLDGEVVCLESFLSDLRQSLANKQLPTPSASLLTETTSESPTDSTT